MPTVTDTTSVDVVVVGAGFAGLYLVHRLRRSGLRVVAIERGGDVGGTWYWNRYPGARCDQESVYYSYSFDPDLDREWEWTERYATQPEILRYLNHVADRFGLRDSIECNAEVTSASFNELGETWHVTVADGRSWQSSFVILATGCLSTPLVPELPGLDAFTGRVLFTSTWPEGDIDFHGRRVAVIGTGSSGVQSIPIIAEQAEHLTVFQRTPSFVLPAQNRPLDRETVANVKARYPELRQMARLSSFGSPAVNVPTKSAMEVDPREREQAYAHAYEFGHLGALIQTYNDLLTNPDANDTAAEYVRSRIRLAVHDHDVAERLVPTDYPLGTKRPCLGTDYYETFNRDNVTLVSVRDTPIVVVGPSSITTTRATVVIDDLVFATGFDAITGSITRIAIRGRAGQLLADTWRDGPSAYLGIATSGFPNLFFVTGPGSPSVLSNVVVSIEQHVQWIADCLDHMLARGLAVVEVDPQSEDAWMGHVAEVADRTLFPRTASWYMGANVHGKPRVFMPYVGGVGTFREKCDDVATAGYRGLRFSSGSRSVRDPAPRDIALSVD